MSDQEINKEIAKACGWKLIHGSTHPVGSEGYNPSTGVLEHIHSYTTDLNAMADAEKTLNVNQLSEYADQLDKVCVPTHICALTHWQSAVCATARQRAEAFLRTLNLWKQPTPPATAAEQEKV